jgi:hypothetical protein
MKKRTVIIIIVVLIPAVFLGWRFVRPMNIFNVSKAFELPIATDQAPPMFKTLGAEECAACHREVYEEWRTTIHSRAWTDPYFQADWRFDGGQQICKNCHTPLDRQQEHRVLGFRDQDKWDPILEPNPAFDPKLQHEGVTCGACHFRAGLILGPYGDTVSPHPVGKWDNPNQACVRCHVVPGDRWDTFFRFPPCGTVAEIRAARGGDNTPASGVSGELIVDNLTDMNCVECHMPPVQRPLVTGGTARPARRHLWRGGHDPDTVKSGLEISLQQNPVTAGRKRRVTLTLTNTGVAHYLPTGIPDRFLTIDLRLLDGNDMLVKEKRYAIKRTVMWRPFIIDLKDTRLPYLEPRDYTLEFSDQDGAVMIEAVVRYHLLDEQRRRRIGYENQEPIAYDVFRQRLPVTAIAAHDGRRN